MERLGRAGRQRQQQQPWGRGFPEQVRDVWSCCILLLTAKNGSFSLSVSLSLFIALWMKERQKKPCRESLQPHPSPNLLLPPQASLSCLAIGSTPHLPPAPPPSSNSPFDVSILGKGRGGWGVTAATALFVTSSVVDVERQRVE